MISLILVLLAPLAATPSLEERLKTPTTPPLVRSQHETESHAFAVKVRPAVAKVGETVTVEVSIAEKLKDTDPRYGKRRPLEKATLEGTLVGAGASPFVASRNSLPLRDAGAYAFTFTAPKAGLYAFHLRGKTETGAIELKVPVSYEVWPIAADAALPALPAKRPAAEAGDLAHGKNLCAERCKPEVAGVRSEKGAPVFISSIVGATHDDNALLKNVLKPEAAQLEVTQRNDLLHFLRGLHWSVRDFYPDAAFYTANEFTINKHGRKRLEESANVKLTPETERGTVFVVYKAAEPAAAARYIPYEDRVARSQLKRGDKLGYLMFLEVPGERRAEELAVALGTEPTYAITKLRARDAHGQADNGINTQLRAFIGKGKFNDPKSLASGPAPLRNQLTPVYLRAAELATMYYGEERELASFEQALE